MNYCDSLRMKMIFYPKKEKKRKLTKSKFSKVMHLFSKLGAFNFALSLFSGTSKINHPFSKKEKKKKERDKNPFQK